MIIQSQQSTQDMNLDSSQIVVPRSREATPNATQHNKLHSQSLPTSSLTPPPSTQQSRAPVIARTPSPIGLLASPPPTTKANTETTSAMATSTDIPSEDQIGSASVEDLRQMVSNLSLSLRDARTSAAHYNLQYNMLIIESSKANSSLLVELEMMQRELDVLQEAEIRRRGATSPRHNLEAAAHRDLISDLNRQIGILNAEIQKQQAFILQTQRVSEYRSERIAVLEEQNERLRQRIKTNREHMNGIIESVRDRSPTSAMNTPSRSYYNTPNRGPLSTPGRRNCDTNNMAFDVLLLADKVISQETATAPSTPRSGHGRTKGPGHTRNTHSLSSLPTTPTRIRAHLSQNIGAPPVLRTPLALSQMLESPHQQQSQPGSHYNYPRQQVSDMHRRRRGSSESTISIPDRDALHHHATQQSLLSRGTASFTGDEIPESSASQAATSMLRSAPTPKRKNLKQAKLTGKITKPAVNTTGAFNKLLHPDDQPISPEKRRLASGIAGAEVERSSGPVGIGASPKKRRVGATESQESVGLGIGLRD